MYDILCVKDADVRGKKVLLRVDFNVPINAEGEIRNDNRIRAALPTINYLLDNDAKLIILTHFGRPKGEEVDLLKTDVIAAKLQEILGREVAKVNGCVGKEVRWKVDQNFKAGKDVVVLENVRFFNEEKDNDKKFSKQLAELADLYVNDAFGVSHREHASVHGVTKFLPSYAGLLLQKEIEVISKAMENPKKPYYVIMGGVKLDTRVPMIEHFIEVADKIFLGGAMRYTFLKSKGLPVGRSIVQDEYLDVAKKLLARAGDKIVLPVDSVCVKDFSKPNDAKIFSNENVGEEFECVDIGPESIELFKEQLMDAKTIIWNGPMGVFETKAYSNGTKAIVEMLAELSEQGVNVIIGGGDSAAAVQKFGFADKMSHISTGGGASLTMFSGKILPGAKALEDAKERSSYSPKGLKKE